MPVRNDWEKIDRELACLVISTGKNIKNMEGKPTKITVALIFNIIGVSREILRKRKLLPKTDEALKNTVDSITSFRIRRLLFVHNEMLKNNETITPRNLLEKSSLKRYHLEGEVREIFDRIFPKNLNSP